MFCHNCGKELKDGAKFCPYCGSRVSSGKQAVPSHPSGTVPDRTDRPSGTSDAKTGKQKPRRHRRRLPAVLAVAVVFAVCVIGFDLFLVLRDSGSKIPQEEKESLTSPIVTGEMLDAACGSSEDALSALNEMSFYYGFENAEDVFEAGYTRDTDLFTVYHFSQIYEGLPVLGHTMNVLVDEDGSVLYFAGNYADITDLMTEPEISADEAAAAAGVTENSEPALAVYVSEDTGEAALVWKFTSSFTQYCVDARTGEILASFDLLSDFDYEGLTDATLELTGQDKESHELNVSYDSDSKTYYMYDREKKLTVGTLTTIPQTYAEFSDDSIFSFKKEKKANASGVDALYNIGLAYDFYEEMFGWTGGDGNGSIPIWAYVDVKKITNSDGKAEDWTNNAACASDDGTNRIYFVFTVTNGDYESSAYPDVVTHEYTHAVQHYALGGNGVGKGYSTTEGDALNEAYSDILAACAKAFYNGGVMDWRLEDYGDGRNIADPGDSYITVYDDYSDDLDCHAASTLISHTAYVMNSGELGEAHTISDYATLAELWYQSLFLMNSESGFSDCRTAVEHAAQLMVSRGKLTRDQYLGVVLAFDSAGIPEETEFYVARADAEFEALVMDWNNGGEEIRYPSFSYQAYTDEDEQWYYQFKGKSGEDIQTVSDLFGGGSSHLLYHIVLFDDYSDRQFAFNLLVLRGGEDEEAWSGAYEHFADTKLSVVTDFGSRTWIIGNVKDEEGDAVAGATVSLENQGNLGQTASVTTDENGGFRLFLYYERESFSLTFARKGFETLEYSGTLSETQLAGPVIGPTGPCSVGTFTLKAISAVLAGSVADEEGNSLPGVSVTAVSEEGKSISAVTDEDGYYLLSCPEGSYTITYSLESYKSQKAEVDVSEEMCKSATESAPYQLDQITLPQTTDILEMLNTRQDILDAMDASKKLSGTSFMMDDNGGYYYKSNTENYALCYYGEPVAAVYSDNSSNVLAVMEDGSVYNGITLVSDDCDIRDVAWKTHSTNIDAYLLDRDGTLYYYNPYTAYNKVSNASGVYAEDYYNSFSVLETDIRFTAICRAQSNILCFGLDSNVYMPNMLISGISGEWKDVDTSGWTDIVVAACAYDDNNDIYTVAGISADGTLYATGDYADDILAMGELCYISMSDNASIIVGLTPDGNLKYAGPEADDFAKANLTDIKGIKVWKKMLWAVDASGIIYSVDSDGAVTEYSAAGVQAGNCYYLSADGTVSASGRSGITITDENKVKLLYYNELSQGTYNSGRAFNNHTEDLTDKYQFMTLDFDGDGVEELFLKDGYFITRILCVYNGELSTSVTMYSAGTMVYYPSAHLLIQPSYGSGLETYEAGLYENGSYKEVLSWSQDYAGNGFYAEYLGEETLSYTDAEGDALREEQNYDSVISSGEFDVLWENLVGDEEPVELEGNYLLCTADNLKTLLD